MKWLITAVVFLILLLPTFKVARWLTRRGRRQFTFYMMWCFICLLDVYNHWSVKSLLGAGLFALLAIWIYVGKNNKTPW